MGVGTGGKVTIFNGYGKSDVIVDVTGWFTDASATAVVAAPENSDIVTSQLH